MKHPDVNEMSTPESTESVAQDSATETEEVTLERLEQLANAADQGELNEPERKPEAEPEEQPPPEQPWVRRTRVL